MKSRTGDNLCMWVVSAAWRPFITEIGKSASRSTNSSKFYLRTTVAWPLCLPPFSLIRDFGKPNIRGNASKITSVLHVIDKSDRIPPMKATSVTFWPSLRHDSWFRSRVRYIMLENSSIMLLSVTPKNLVLCPKLCSKNIALCSPDFYCIQHVLITAA